MKTFTKVLLIVVLLAVIVIPASLLSSATEMTVYSSNCGTGCGFIDGNLKCNESFVGSVTELTVTVNGKPAYICNGYLGVQHNGIRNADDKTSNHFQLGIVGADVVKGDNVLVVTDKGGNTVTHTFTSDTRILGISYSKVTADEEKRTVTAEIVFTDDPGFAIGTTFEGKCHDDHSNSTTFKVTDYHRGTKVYTIVGEGYTTEKSLLEFKVTSSGDYKDAWFAAAINYKLTVPRAALSSNDTNMVISNTTKLSLSDVTGTPGDASKLTNGVESDSGKFECNISKLPATITFKTAEAVDASYLVLYTGNDDESYGGRAPGAFTLYGSNDNGVTWTVIKDVKASGIPTGGVKNYAPYAFALTDTAKYNTYKLEIIDTTGAGHFQMGELELYTGNVSECLSLDDSKTVVDNATELPLSDVKSTQGDASKLTNGVGDGTGKLEFSASKFPVDITFKTAQAVDASYLVLYTGNDDEGNSGRAPGVFTLYGSNDGGATWTAIKDVKASGIPKSQGEGLKNYSPYAFALTDTTKYDTYKLTITANLGSHWFQMGELELYTGDVTFSAVESSYEQGSADAYTGTAPDWSILDSITVGGVIYNQYESGWVNTKTEKTVTPIKDGNTYMVGDADEYVVVMATLGASDNVTLTNNIDLPYGSFTVSGTYKGAFDGAGYTVTGIDKVMFNQTDGATIKNVTLYGQIGSEESPVTNRRTATITYYMSGGSVTNVTSYVDIYVNSTDLNLGGIVGYTYGNACTFTNVTYAGSFAVTGNAKDNSGLGGIVGYLSSDATFNNCVFTGSLTVGGGTANYVNVGGIVGRVTKSATLTNCVSTGTIVEKDDNIKNVGALAGELKGTIQGGYVNATLPDGTQTITGTGSATDVNVGETVGEVLKTVTVGSVTYNQYAYGWKNETTGRIFNLMKDGSTYLIGNGDADAYIAAMATIGGSSNNVTLTNDVSLLYGSPVVSGTYKGTFDGQGYTVTGITDTMFNKVSGGTVKNVTLYGTIGSKESPATNRKTATVTYDLESGGTVSNVVSYVDIYVALPDGAGDGYNAGGVVGYAKNNNTVTNITYAGTLTAEWNAGGDGALGGIVGYANANGESNSINYISCAFTGKIIVEGTQSTTLNIGGILGRGRHTNNLTNCVSTGTITVDAPNVSTKNYGDLVGEYASDAKNSVISGGYAAATLPDGGKSFCGNQGGVTEDKITAYTAETAETKYNTFEVDGETYQEYNFGYLNTKTYQISTDVHSPYHTPDEAVREDGKAATCKEKGSYDEVVYCECGKELSRVEHVIPVDESNHVGEFTYTDNKNGKDHTIICDCTGVVGTEKHDFDNDEKTCVCGVVAVYTVTWKVNGEVYGEPTEFAFGATVTAPDYTASEGYTFSGWTVPETMPAENIILNATLTVNEYTITWTVNGEEYTTTTVAYGAAITVPEYTAPAGNTFSGWTVPATMPAENLELNATLTVNEYTITWTVNGEEYTTTTVAYGAVITAPVYNVTTGYTFSGWKIPDTMPAEDITLNATLTAKTFNVTWTVNGETYKIIPVAFGEAIVAPEYTAPEGYTFNEWTNIPATMPANDITLNATTTAKTFNVTWTVDGGFFATTPVTYGAAIIAPTYKAPTGYTFSGWDVPATMPAKDITLDAALIVNKYKVTWTVNGKAYGEPTEFAYGAAITVPTYEAPEGYTFSGWKAPATMPAEDLELDATLTVNTYTVTWNINGELYKETTVAYGEAIVAPEYTAPEGYAFTAWTGIPDTMPAKPLAFDATETVNTYTVTWTINDEFFAETTVTYGEVITAPEYDVTTGYTFFGWKVPATMPAENITLDAVLSVNSYKITWKINGEEYDTTTVEFGATVEAPAYAVPEGYTFSGWTTAPETMPAQNLELNATLTENKINSYTITWTVNGKPFTTTSVVVGEAITVPAYTAPEGYSFSGWDVPATMPEENLTLDATQTINTYTVTWTINNKPYKTTEVVYGKVITVPAYEAPEGYTFTAWTGIPETMPAKDITLDATETVNSYTVTWTVNGEFYAKTKFAYGASVAAPSYSVPEGATFSGWDVPETMPAKDITLDAKLKDLLYTITWTVNGEEYATTEVAYGAVITAPKYTAPEGYTFSGWKVPATMPAEDITLDATLTANTYTITWTVDGKEYATTEVVFGKAITAPAYKVPEGYTFSNWTVPETMPAKDITLDATLTVNTYTITWTVNGEDYATAEVVFGKAITAPAYKVPEGYTFSGWTVPETMPAKDITLDATLKANTYTVTWTVNDKEYTTTEVVFGKAITAPAYKVPEGYTFSGWNNVPATMPAKDITVNGTLTANTYTVTWTVNGEDYAATEVVFGKAITAPAYKVPEGYTFSGWAIPETVPAKDITLDATLTANTYTVTWTINGKDYATTEVVFGKAITAPAYKAPAGYIFTAWTNIPETMPAKNITLDATLTANTGDGIVAENGGLYYYENGKLAYKGLIPYNGGYIYVRSNGQLAVGLSWVSYFGEGVDFTEGHYYFDKDGQMVSSGIYDGYMFINGKRVDRYALVELDGDLYFVGDYRKIAVNKSVYLTEEYLVGFTNTDGTPLTPGWYDFDAEGKMVIKHGIYDGFMYINNIKVERYALIEFDGNYYFVGDYRKIAVNKSVYLTEEYLVGFTNTDGTPLTPGWYDFDAEGKMVIKHGIYDGFMYINNIKVERYALIEFDGNYYFVGDYRKIAVNKSVYLTEEYLVGFTNTDGTPLTPGWYDFDAEGKMAIKHGIYDGFMYINNVKVERYALIEFDGNYYFVGDYRKIVVNKSVYLTEGYLIGFTNTDGTPLTPDWYDFDAEGKMIR